MKKVLSSICAAAVLLLTACYEDKGSYDYHFDSMNEIDLESISFSPEAFETVAGTTIEFQQPLEEDEVQRVSVSLNQSLTDNFDQLDFLWKRSYTKDGEAVTDSIYTKGYLDVELPAGKSISYSVLLKITDNSTSIAYYKSLIIKTRPIFQNSLFVLHGNQNGDMTLGNVMMLGDHAEVTLDAYKKAKPEAADSPFKNTVALAYNTYFASMTILQRGESRNLCAFNLDGTGQIYEPFGLTTKFNPYYVMPVSDETTTSFIPNRFIFTGSAETSADYKCILSQDGRFYIARQYLSFYIPGEGAADENALHQADYNVSAVTMSENYYVMWDKKDNRFLYLSKYDNYDYKEGERRNTLSNPILDAKVDLAGLGSLTPVGKTAVYAYVKDRDGFSNSFFIFKDPDVAQYYIYELTPTDSKDDKSLFKGDESAEGEAGFTITGKMLNGFNPSTFNTITYSAWFSTNFLFYAVDGTVYRYNTSNGDKTPLYSAPEGYKISVLKFRSYDSGIRPGDLGRYLSIGMNKGTEGAIAEIKLTTAGDLDEEFTTVFADGDGNEKFKNIRDVQFAHIFMYGSN